MILDEITYGEPDHSILLENDPVEIREAVLWLAGVGAGQLDQYPSYNPYKLAPEVTQRRMRSLLFWLPFIEQFVELKQSDRKAFIEGGSFSRLRFPVSPRFFSFAPSSLNPGATSSRWRRRIGGVIIQKWRLLNEDGSINAANFDELTKTYETWRKFHKAADNLTARIRNSLWAISDNLQKVVDANFSQLVKRTRAVSFHRNGLLLTSEEEPENTGIETWNRLEGYAEADVFDRPLLDRRKLLEVFVVREQEAGDAWIKQHLNYENWPLVHAVAYLTHSGDMREVYRTITAAESDSDRPNQVNLGLIKIYSERAAQENEAEPYVAAEVNESAIEHLRCLLRSGKVGSTGLNSKTHTFEEISAQSWYYLKLTDSWDPYQVTLEDPNEPTRLCWYHIVIDFEALKKIVPPVHDDGSYVPKLNVAEQVALDSKEKQPPGRKPESQDAAREAVEEIFGSIGKHTTWDAMHYEVNEVLKRKNGQIKFVSLSTLKRAIKLRSRTTKS